MTFFGLKLRQDLENRAAQLHQQFPEVHSPGLYYCGHTKHSRLAPAKLVYNYKLRNFVAFTLDRKIFRRRVSKIKRYGCLS